MYSSRLPIISSKDKNLIHRYLLWCYKTTKEDLDRIDRYFTQALVDQRILTHLRKMKADGAAYEKKIDDFENYMKTKHNNALVKKYLNPHSSKKTLAPDYWYLETRLKAIERVIVEFLGRKELKTIQALYEEEMKRRILAATDH